MLARVDYERLEALRDAADTVAELAYSYAYKDGQRPLRPLWVYLSLYAGHVGRELSDVLRGESCDG